MLTTKERQQEAEKVFATYMILPEKEKTMLLAYSTALRDRALLDKNTRQQLDLCEEQQLPRNMPESVAKQERGEGSD